jgi:hypothetical protein
LALRTSRPFDSSLVPRVDVRISEQIKGRERERERDSKCNFLNLIFRRELSVVLTLFDGKTIVLEYLSNSHNGADGWNQNKGKSESVDKMENNFSECILR